VNYLEARTDFSQATAPPSGAGNGIRVGLQKLFNDQNEEAKLLVFQLELLKNHLVQTEPLFYK